MTTHWYKEPWAWFIFILPFTAVVAGIATYIIANTNADPLVVDDYYKKGKAINLQLSKIKLAQKLGMRFSLTTENDELIIRPTGIEKTFPLLYVSFYHPTQEEKDKAYTLTPDGNGDFRQQLEKTLEGKWKITIMTFDKKWKIQNTIYLPQTSLIDITPNKK